MLNRFVSWLRNAPIADPVDRRNAPTMQGLFLLMGLSIPASWIYFLATGGVPTGGVVMMVLSIGMAALALACVAMIRKGRFRAAVILFLAVLLLIQEANYLQMGFKLLGTNQIDQFLMLIIGGLVLGRRALWTIFFALLVVAMSGFAVDAYRLMDAGQAGTVAYSPLFSVLFGYLLVALVLDRTITALRESLAESNARGRELQREMAERERTHTQLIHAQKMEASGRLASGIAHDFNNILGVVLGFASQRHSEAGDGHPRVAMLEDSLEGVEIAARRGEAISRKLLRFSRNDVAHVETFDAGQAMEDVRPMLRQMFDAQVRIHVDTGQAPLPVRLDRSQFELMLLNIAANARDAMPEGGIFSAIARRASSPHGDRIQIELTDSGDGMSDAAVQRAFEPFFSTKPAESGTGLGLSVVRDLVEHAGGTIGIDSTPGKGTTIHIQLPVAQAAILDSAERASSRTGTRVA